MSRRVHPLNANLFELDGQLIWQIDAKQIPETRRERAQALQRYFGKVAENLSPWLVLLEEETNAFSLGRLRNGVVDLSARALDGGQMALYFAALALRGESEESASLRLLQNDAKFKVHAQGGAGMSAISSQVSSLRRVSWDVNLRKLLPTGQSLHRVSIADTGASLDVSVVDAGEPILVVRTDELQASSQRGKSLKSSRGGKTLVPLAGFDAAQVVQSLGLELGLASNFSVCWVSGLKPGAEAASIDCTVLGCRGGAVDALQSEVLSASVKLSISAAAAIPGTVLHQMVRALPGVDARIGLEDGVLVACAEVSAAHDWTLKTLSVQQSVKLVMSVALQELA